MKTRERIKATIVVALGFVAFAVVHGTLVRAGAEWQVSAGSGIGAGLTTLFALGLMLR